MTVCIGALCTRVNVADTVVVASDRMLTHQEFIQFEHDISKISIITPNSVMLSAGLTPPSTDLSQKLIGAFQGESPGIEEVAVRAAELYALLRQEQIDAAIFRPRGMTIQDFYLNGAQANFHAHIATEIDNQVTAYDYGVETILAGVDDLGGQLYSIGNPGMYYNFKQTGYVALGSGGVHALQSMIGFGHSYLHGLAETVFTVYASKKRAEVAPGVGKNFDLYVVWEGGMYQLVPPQIEKLDALYQKFQQPVSTDLAKMVDELQLFGVIEQENNTNETITNTNESFTEAVQPEDDNDAESSSH